MALFTVIYEFNASKQSFLDTIYSYLQFCCHLAVIFGHYLQIFTILLSFNSPFWTLFTVIYKFTAHLTVISWPYLQLFTDLMSVNSHFWTLFTVIYNFAVI